MCVDDENIYCFNQYLQAVNVYDKNGNFEYSLKVPSRRKGRGCIYIKDKYFCIRNDYDDVYQYKNGEFLYKGTLELDEDDERGIYQIIDKEGCMVASKDYTEYSELVGFFDDEIITEEDWEADIFECDWLVEDENGDVYEVNLLRTKLMKNGQTLREQPFHQSLACSTVLSTLCFFAIALLQRLVEWIVEGRNA